MSTGTPGRGGKQPPRDVIDLIDAVREIAPAIDRHGHSTAEKLGEVARAGRELAGVVDGAVGLVGAVLGATATAPRAARARPTRRRPPPDVEPNEIEEARVRREMRERGMIR